jgi:hypothetical protein
MPDDWEVSDEEIDAWVEGWEAVDRAAAEYLAERIPGVQDSSIEDRGDWLDDLAETMSPSEPPGDGEVEVESTVMALQHADWLGLAMGVVRRGPGGVLDPVLVQADIDALEDVEGEIEDREGHLAVLQVALLHLTPLWQDLGVLDEDAQFTERGVWGLPRALCRLWSPTP